MVTIRGHFYFPQYRLKSTILIILLGIAYLFYMLFELAQHRKLDIRKELCKIFLLTLIANIIAISIFPIYIFSNSEVVSTWGFGKQTLISFNPYNDFLNLKNMIEFIFNYVGIGLFIMVIFHKITNNLILLIFMIIPTFIECLKLLLSYFYLLSTPFDIFYIILGLLSELIGLFIYKVGRCLVI